MPWGSRACFKLFPGFKHFTHRLYIGEHSYALRRRWKRKHVRDKWLVWPNKFKRHVGVTVNFNFNVSDASCYIDSAHDLGVLSADFCKFIHIDRECWIKLGFVVLFVTMYLKSASDNKTSIYTVATCGTDHLIKIWRVFCLVDAVHMGSKTRLVPSTPQVCFWVYWIDITVTDSSSFHLTRNMNAVILWFLAQKLWTQNVLWLYPRMAAQ